MSLPEINTKPQVTVREYTDENGNSITEKTTVEDNRKQTVIITEKIIKEMTGGVHVVQAHKEKLSSLDTRIKGLTVGGCDATEDEKFRDTLLSILKEKENTL